MLFQPSIQIQQLHYSIDHNVIFRDLSLSFRICKTAIVGRNGIGKSSLLKLLLSELNPDFGSIHIDGTVSYCPQNFTFYRDKTIAEVFGIAEKLKALLAIETGSCDERDFELLHDDWDFKERFFQQLNAFNIGNLKTERLVETLSGGEITRLFLARCFFQQTDFVILDEPTNNLDLISKQLLFSAIKNSACGFIIVSHDRDLLNLMDSIIELTSLGAEIYGGNYALFQKQKNLICEARFHECHEAKKQLKQVKRKIQITHEKMEQRNAQGNQIRKRGGQSKLILNSMQERSEQTKSFLNNQAEHAIKKAKTFLSESSKKLDLYRKINISLPGTKVAQNKLILKCEHVSFCYSGSNLLLDNFDFTIQGPERIAIQGENGSGKTTLIKLLLGVLSPLSGRIVKGVSNIQYFDQQVSLLNPALSVLGNYLMMNPTVCERQARFNLADFLFRNKAVEKLASELSGGERLRAGLACALMSNVSPQLLILDEPTNHLDLESIANLEAALNCYQGALIVISHDQAFIQNIRITKSIKAPF